MDPAELLGSREGRLTLVDVLARRRLRGLQRERSRRKPPGTTRPGGPGTVKIRELPKAPTSSWSITILDEGPPEPGLDHRKYDLSLTRNEFFESRQHGQDRSPSAHRDQARTPHGSVHRQGVASLAAEAPRLPGKRAGRCHSRPENLRRRRARKTARTSPSSTPACPPPGECSSPRSSSSWSKRQGPLATCDARSVEPARAARLEVYFSLVTRLNSGYDGRSVRNPPRAMVSQATHGDVRRRKLPFPDLPGREPPDVSLRRRRRAVRTGRYRPKPR